MHRYLVVANQTLDSDELVALVRERTVEGPAEFWLVVPATPVKDLATNAMPIPMPVMGGISALPAPPEEARRRAQVNLDAAVTKLTAAGGKVNGAVADPDPVRAVAEAVRGREFDEIIVFTLPPRLSRWLHHDLPTRLQHEFDLPVTDVVVKDV
jgi:GABA permease